MRRLHTVYCVNLVTVKVGGEVYSSLKVFYYYNNYNNERSIYPYSTEGLCGV